MHLDVCHMVGYPVLSTCRNVTMALYNRLSRHGEVNPVSEDPAIISRTSLAIQQCRVPFDHRSEILDVTMQCKRH